MPYYCTVPRCTSMAGKAKNVSFHQFPRDEELAKLWNKILKRGKPYTKYSKVCSLHFRPEDYTITSVGKNKGQWRSLRKDAIPSQNLPSESPIATPQRNSGSWVQSPQLPMATRAQQQMAQAIYLQTMLAMQAANGSQLTPTLEIAPPNPPSPNLPSPVDLEQCPIETEPQSTSENQETPQNMSYKCQECTKCFKDPDVFVLHKRGHIREMLKKGIEKENQHNNELSTINQQDTLRANPILANLLKSGMSNTILPDTNSKANLFDANSILSIENQIMTALAANMENYIRNISTMLQSNSKHSDEEEEMVQNEETLEECGHNLIDKRKDSDSLVKNDNNASLVKNNHNVSENVSFNQIFEQNNDGSDQNDSYLVDDDDSNQGDDSLSQHDENMENSEHDQVDPNFDHSDNIQNYGNSHQIIGDNIVGKEQKRQESNYQINHFVQENQRTVDQNSISQNIPTNNHFINQNFNNSIDYLENEQHFSEKTVNSISETNDDQILRNNKTNNESIQNDLNSQKVDHDFDQQYRTFINQIDRQIGQTDEVINDETDHIIAYPTDKTINSQFDQIM